MVPFSSQPVIHQPPRKGKISPNGLTQVLSQQAVDEGITEVIGDGSIVFVATVEGSQQSAWPIGGDATHVGIDHSQGAGPIRRKITEQIQQIVALTMNSRSSREIDLGNLAAGRIEKSGLRPVLGEVIGIDDGGMKPTIVALEPPSHPLHHKIDVVGFIIGRDTDYQIQWATIEIVFNEPVVLIHQLILPF